MTYIFFGHDFMGMPIALRLQQEGQTVYYGQIESLADVGQEDNEDPEQKKRRLSLYDGMLDNKYPADKLLKALAKLNNKDDYFVIFDFNYYWPMADQVKKMGFKGFLPTKEDYLLESDRELGKEEVIKNFKDLEVAEHQEFKKIDDAIGFLSENENLYVLKGFNKDACTVVPNGQNDIKVNHAEIEDMLKTHQKDYESEGFILEEKIIDVIEFTPEAISYDGKVVGVNMDIEAKTLGAGDIGYMTGCALNTICWDTVGSKIYESFLAPREKAMLRPGQMTVWDASVLYSPSKKKFYFGEFCSNRWGFDSIYAELSTQPSVTQYFETLFSGGELYTKDGDIPRYGSSIRIFNLIKDKIPNADKTLANSIILSNPTDKNIWLTDVKKQKGELLKENKLVTAGNCDDMAAVSGTGLTFEDSVEMAYNNLKNFYFGDMYYRPKFDFLSKDYPSSIANRIDFIDKMYGNES